MILFPVGAPSRRLPACALAGAVMLAASSAGAAIMSFDGQQIQVQEFQLVPDDEGVILTSEPETVDDQVEFSSFGFSLNFDIDFGGSLIQLTANESFGAASGFSFGFIFTDVDDTIALFESVDVISSTGYTGDVANAVTWTGNRIVFDFDGVGVEPFETGENPVLTLDVTFKDETPVIPLPATLPLALGALGTLAAIGRRRTA